jgi:hypothetical protein
VTYERPAVEQRVRVAGPVIAGVTVASPVGITPTWAQHDAPDAGTEEP